MAEVDAPDIQPTAQASSPALLCNNVSVWSLITGPEASNWSRLLVCSHLDSSTRLALFSTCKAASNTVLVNADQVCIYLDDKEEQPREDELLSLDRLRAIRAALQTRGKLRTKLVLIFGSASLLNFALGVLEAGTTWLDELDINRPNDDDDLEELPTAFLASVGRCCPNLRALSLPQTPKMPPVRFFPKLQELSVCLHINSCVRDHAYGSIAPYVKQLAKLAIDSDTLPLPTHPPLLLTPGSIATRLRYLQLHTTLDDTGLGLLLQCAPALEELTVTEVRLESAAHAQAQTQWRQLHTHVLPLSSLARLPVAAEGLHVKVDWSGTLVCDVMLPQLQTSDLKGADLDFSHVDVCVDSSWVVVEPGEDIHVADQPAALRAGLSLLRDCPPKNVSMNGFLTLQGWTMSRDVVQELRQLPQYPMDLVLCSCLVWLPQPAHLYSTLLRLLPDSVCGVTIDRGADELTDAQIQSICLGAPNNRSAQVPLSVRLPDRAALVQAIQQKMDQGTYPNVIIGA